MRHDTDLAARPSWASRAQRERQKPSLGATSERRALQCARALSAVHLNLRIRYAMARVADLIKGECFGLYWV